MLFAIPIYFEGGYLEAVLGAKVLVPRQILLADAQTDLQKHVTI